MILCYKCLYVIKYSTPEYKVVVKEDVFKGVIDAEFETPNDDETKKLAVVKNGWKLLPLKLNVTLAVFEIELGVRVKERLEELYRR